MSQPFSKKDKWELTIIAILLTVMIGGLSLKVKVFSEPTPPSEAKYLPKFQVNQCFNRNGVHEPWEPDGPDGMIAQVGVEQYLILYEGEANRRSLQKTAIPSFMRTFDQSHYRVVCPESWINHKGGKKK